MFTYRRPWLLWILGAKIKHALCRKKIKESKNCLRLCNAVVLGLILRLQVRFWCTTGRRTDVYIQLFKITNYFKLTRLREYSWRLSILFYECMHLKDMHISLMYHIMLKSLQYMFTTVKHETNLGPPWPSG